MKTPRHDDTLASMLVAGARAEKLADRWAKEHEAEIEDPTDLFLTLVAPVRLELTPLESEKARERAARPVKWENIDLALKGDGGGRTDKIISALGKLAVRHGLLFVSLERCVDGPWACVDVLRARIGDFHLIFHMDNFSEGVADKAIQDKIREKRSNA